MNNFFDHFKRILIALLSIVIVICSVPQFSIRSHAMGSYYATQQSILYLTSYLSSRGYSIAHEYGHDYPTVQELLDMNMDRQGQLLNEFAVKLDAFGETHDLPDLGERFINSIKAACYTGALILSPTVRDLVDTYLATSYNPSTNGVSIGTTTTSIADYSNPAEFEYTYTYSSNINYISFNSASIAVFGVQNGYPIYICFLPEDVSNFSYNALNNTYTFEPATSNIYWYATTVFNNATYRIPYYGISGIPSFLYYEQILNNSQQPSATRVLEAYLQGQYSDIEKDVVITRITDTSSTDVLTSTNTIGQDGTVEGDYTLYLPYGESLAQIIDRYNQQDITYDQMINALGLSSVDNDATTQEKEAALSHVATPDSTYDWLTRTAWGSETITETTSDIAQSHAEESSIADSIGDTLKGGNDSEDDNNKNRGKGLLAALLIGLGIWSTPIIAGDPSGESDSGGADDGSGDDDSHPGYLQDTIAGMAIAGTVMDSFFSAAGGSDGYGFVYTVGASFVIFSVVIGAANYFGALFHGDDTKQMKKSSALNNSPNKTRKQSSYSNKNGIVT